MFAISEIFGIAKLFQKLIFKILNSETTILFRTKMYGKMRTS
ncbi:5206_t:CDS:1, partial [Entrophospora sp. SA101]